MSNWIITSKPSFQAEWLLLPDQESQQALASIERLAQDPRPDGVFKRQLAHLDGTLHTTSAGQYRLYYTFEYPHIRLLAIRPRRTKLDEPALLQLSAEEDPSLDEAATPPQEIDWHALLSKHGYGLRPLPTPITKEMLARLHVPKRHHDRLLAMHTWEGLLNCRGVPHDVLQRIQHALEKKPLAQIAMQPNYLLGHTTDLKRYTDGDLPGFLLQLAPEQYEAAKRSLSAGGPTQVKGKPGTGKSTVALYRIKFLLEQLAHPGQPEPRILFTTYTNALVESSKALLQQLLGDGAALVDVSTADKLVFSLLKEPCHPVDESTLTWLIKAAIEEALPEEEMRQRFLNKLSYDYLKEEICQLILARQVSSLQHYIDLDRKVRRVPLSKKMDRPLVWHIYERVLSRLEEMRQQTWQQIRLRAEAQLGMHAEYPPYHAVIVDEAQDLDPSVLRILVKLCAAPNRFFITADANQAIYRAGFTWEDVDASLKFRGRTTILKTNYRSTREIGEAAHSYLILGAEDSEAADPWIHYTSGKRPAVRWTQSEEEEWQLLGTFVTNAVRAMLLGPGSCAILCPTKYAGEAIAQALRKQGIVARFFASNQVDLTSPDVKVLTLHASKGLEFPTVALAGFQGSRYACGYEDISEEERAELLIKDRRLLFVGMTRAMQTLLVLLPAGTMSPVLTGFDATYWDGGQQDHTVTGSSQGREAVTSGR